MAILVIGGTGFIGSHLVVSLKKQGHEVILFNGDISKREDIEKFNGQQGISCVIHLAAVINSRDKNLFWKINVEGTKNIIDLSRRLSASRLIFLSSIRAISTIKDPYTESKRVAEELVAKSGLSYIILRPSLIYGSGDNKNISSLIKLAKQLPIVPVLPFRMQPLFIDDLIKAILACLDLSAGQIINVVGPEIISFKDLWNRLKALGFRFHQVDTPKFFCLLLKLLSFLPFFPLTPWQIKTWLADEVFDDQSWQRILNIEATPFSAGLKKISI